MPLELKFRSVAIALLLFLFLLLGGCAHSREKRIQEGKASWYGGEYQGRQTASGETFDKNKLTAAHPTLPFQTIALVTNLLNGRSVKVRINDRGPFKHGRIIDLSEGAARALGMVREGVVPVRIEILWVGSKGR